MAVVLMLERDPLRRMLAGALADDGHAVCACPDPVGLVAEAEDQADCIAVVSPWSPSPRALEGDGLNEIRRLAAAVPTVLVSAEPWTDRVVADELGVAALVPAPIDPPAFCAVVRQVAAAMPALRQDAAAACAREKTPRDSSLLELRAARERLGRSRQRLDSSGAR